MHPHDHDRLEIMYLDWFNNFLSIKHFSEYWDITRSSAVRLIIAMHNLNKKEN